jgi:hypothetical protein
MFPTSINFLDSPATDSAVTYSVLLTVFNTGTAYVNRAGAAADFLSTSSLTVIEVKV